MHCNYWIKSIFHLCLLKELLKIYPVSYQKMKMLDMIHVSVKTKMERLYHCSILSLVSCQKIKNLFVQVLFALIFIDGAQ